MNNLPTNRPVGGVQCVALEQSLGLTTLLGCKMRDEYIRWDAVAGRYGDLLWFPRAVGAGLGGTFTQPAPTADSEVGILQITSNAGDNAPTALALCTGQGVDQGTAAVTNQFWRRPGPGWAWVVKVRVDAGAGANAYAYVGLTSDTTTSIEPIAGLGATDGLGFRARVVGAGPYNWMGLSKAAGVETTVNMGVSANDTWRILAMLGRNMTAGTFDCFTVDCSNAERGPTWALIGTLSTNIPAATLKPVIQVGGQAKSIYIDLWETGGTMAR